MKINNFKSKIILLVGLILLITACESKTKISNPIIDGYFADPAIVKFEDKYYIYATIDPWGGNELAVLVTKDFKNFKRENINWPTKEACTSPTSWSANVWAPSVVQAHDENFYMYVSVGSEIWVGKSEHPLGPWQNAKSNGSPLIFSEYFPGFHMIDADCFIDDDGRIFLYWGSGLNWVNGKCFVVELEADMVTFKNVPKDITPQNYFEGPFMLKHNGNYYLMYSDGKAIDSTYNVKYSIGKTPLGPWEYGKNNPLLSSESDSITVGPGHHTVFKKGNQHFILYHRIFPQKKDYVLRRLCIDSLNFDKNREIKKVIPHGIEW